MTSSRPTQTSRFTTEQRLILGNVYTLILSWRNEKKKPIETTSSAVTEDQTGETLQPDGSQSGGSSG